MVILGTLDGRKGKESVLRLEDMPLPDGVWDLNEAEVTVGLHVLKIP